MSTPQVPPGPRYPRPLQTMGWLKRPGPWMERCRDRYGDTFTIRIANEGEWVLMSHPDAVREIFTGDPALLHAGKANRILLPILGPDSVLLLDGSSHLRQRKLMLPSFHGDRMRRYESLMVDLAEREVATWPEGDALALMPRMQALTMEVILRAVFGLREGDRLERMRTALTRMLDFVTRPTSFVLMASLGPERFGTLPMLRRMLAPVDELLLEEIRERRAAGGLAEQDDIMSLLLQATHEDGSPMGDSELRDELITLLLAGHETTATSLAWALERLLHHPAAWDRLRDEAATGETAYIDATVKETLRLRPVFPVVVRELQEPMEIAGHLLPAGVRVAPCIYLMHRRPELYPEPDAFRPERWLDQTPGTYTWIPFGGGIRRCLGASFAMFEMSTVLGVIARSANLRASRPEHGERVLRRAIMLTPEHGAEAVREPVPA